MEKKTTTKSVFATLNAINCNEHTEKKGNLTYLSWSWAWQMVKQNYPNATYTIYEREDGTPYFTDGRTAWVKTGVTIEGIEHIEYLPIMDFRNVSIPLEKITSMDMNKTIQRSLTKACARHGLGLYIYAGEDLPDEEVKARKTDAGNGAAAKAVTVDTVKAWLERVASDADLIAAWKACPESLHAEVQPLFSAKRQQLKGGAR